MRLQEELQRREEELRHKEELFRQQQRELQRHRQEDMYLQVNNNRDKIMLGLFTCVL